MSRYTQSNHKQRIVGRYKDLFILTKIRCFSQKQYLKRRSKIQQSNSYSKLTNYNREFMRGMEEIFIDNLYRNDLIFCYDYKSKRYRTDSKEYKELSPKEVADNSTFYGHCYRKNLSMHY